MADAVIPRFRAERAVVPGTYDPLRRPGSSGQRYFSDMQYANPNMPQRIFDPKASGYETQAAYDTRFNNSMDAAVNAARATNTAQANQFGLANLANPARGTRPSAQTLTDAEVIKTFTDIQNNPAYNTERKQIGQSVGAMNRYNVSPERASSLMNVPLSDVNEMMGPYYREFGEAKPEGIANLLSKQTELVSEASRRLPVGSYFLGAGQTAGQTAGETTAENQQALGSQALYEALMENAYNIGNETTGGTTSGTTGATGTTTGGTTNSESWRDLITNAQAQSISSDVRNILNTARDPNEISNQITRLLTGVDSPYSGIPSAAVFNVVRQAAGVPEGQNLTDFYNDFETRPTMRRFYTETGIVPSFASTVDRRDGYSEQDIANAAFYLNSGYLTADQVANRLRQNQQGVEGLDVTGEDVNRYLGDYNTRTDLIKDLGLTEGQQGFSFDQLGMLGASGLENQYLADTFGVDAAALQRAIGGAGTITGLDSANGLSLDQQGTIAGLLESGDASVANVASLYNITPEEVQAGYSTYKNTVAQNAVNEALSGVSPVGGFDKTERDIVADLINSKAVSIGDIAKRYDLNEMDVLSGLLGGGYQDAATLASQVTTAGGDAVTAAELEEYINAYNNPATAVAATGYAQGGNVNGYYLGGPTDGMADQIPATINNMQPAALSDGEFVIPADVVSHLGNGNSDSGAKELYSMMDRIRQDRTGTTKQGRQIDPNKYLA